MRWRQIPSITPSLQWDAHKPTQILNKEDVEIIMSYNSYCIWHILISRGPILLADIQVLPVIAMVTESLENKIPTKSIFLFGNASLFVWLRSRRTCTVTFLINSSLSLKSVKYERP